MFDFMADFLLGPLTNQCTAFTTELNIPCYYVSNLVLTRH